MRKEKERDSVLGQSFGCSFEVKTLIPTLLVIGMFLIGVQSLYKHSRSVPCPKTGLRNAQSSHGTKKLNVVQIRSLPISSEGKFESIPSSASFVKQHKNETDVISVAEDNFGETRRFRAYGSAAHLFVEYGTYRGGNNTFAVVGLASKPLHVFGKPGFECEWISSPDSSMNLSVKGKTYKMLPDWGYGRIYTVVVVNCTFNVSVGTDAKGGQLILHATHGNRYGKPERMVVLSEKRGEYNASLFEPTYQYDFVYCGSSLFGDLNPQRIREWMAYHVRLFGQRSHFVFHDAGGVHPGVRKVLDPWRKAGFVTVQDIRQQEQFDAYYYNQFLIVNDCLHRTRFLSKWTFFFDVDEYLYLKPPDTLQNVMNAFSNYTQVTYEQSPMSNELCWYSTKLENYCRQWGFEKLVFKNVNTKTRWDRKYAIQARNVFATGVHMSENLIGRTLHTKGPKIKYYHYHNTINRRGELCKKFINSTLNSVVYHEKLPYKIDRGMKFFAEDVKKFEVQQIQTLPT
eukprot:c20015_g1_i1 orf=220-1755(-)